MSRLAKRLEEWYRAGPGGAKPGEIDPDSLDPREIEMLRSLGYVQ